MSFTSRWRFGASLKQKMATVFWLFPSLLLRGNASGILAPMGMYAALVLFFGSQAMVSRGSAKTAFSVRRYMARTVQSWHAPRIRSIHRGECSIWRYGSRENKTHLHPKT